jgi:hypothetical protein
MKQYEHLSGDDYLRIEIYHRKGEGFYASVFPVTRKKQGNFILETFMTYQGYKKLILESNFNLTKKYTQAVKESEEIIEKMKSAIKTKYFNNQPTQPQI